MATRRKQSIVDDDGVRGRIREFVVDDAGVAVVIIELATGARVVVPASLLHSDDHGGYRIHARWAQYPAAHDFEVPVIAEQVSVGVRPVERDRVRIRRRVVTEDQVIETALVEERIVIERVAHDTFVDRIPEPRREGDTLIIPCVEEVAVVEKRLRLREELHVRVVREHRTERRTIPVRRHELEIERDADAGTPVVETNPKKQPGGTS